MSGLIRVTITSVYDVLIYLENLRILRILWISNQGEKNPIFVGYMSPNPRVIDFHITSY